MLRAAPSSRLISIAGWAAVLVAIAVGAFGLQLTVYEHENVARVLRDAEQRAAESEAARIGSLLDRAEERALDAVERSGRNLESLRAVPAENPIVESAFLLLGDGRIISPLLGALPKDVALEDDIPPPVVEAALRMLASPAADLEKADHVRAAARTADLPPAWRMRLASQACGLLARGGKLREAAVGYAELLEELAPEAPRAGCPTYLQLAAARAECLQAAGDAALARAAVESALEKLRSREIPCTFAGEQVFLRTARATLVGSEKETPTLLAERERDLDGRRLAVSQLEALRGWILARGRLAAAQAGRERSGAETASARRQERYFEADTAAAGRRPMLAVWELRRSESPAGGAGAAAQGFLVSAAGLASSLREALASSGSPVWSFRLPDGAADDGFIAMARLPGDRDFIQIGLERPEWERRVSQARQPFVLAGVLIAGLLVALVLAVVAFFRGVRREMALSRMKTEFVANVSHELKTPLALLRLFGETLLLGRGDAEQREKYCRVITRESERLTQLVASVLSFASIEAGKKSYDLRPCDLCRLVRETFESYRFHLDAEGFAHRVETPEEPVEVNADPDAVAEALINLLENAVKYSPQTKDITIRVEADAAGARVTVIDRGVGISAEDQAKVFDDYYRTKEARALGTRGSGLGLSLVRHILQGHGGRVELRSTPGVGSEFSLHFPRPAR